MTELFEGPSYIDYANAVNIFDINFANAQDIK